MVQYNPYAGELRGRLWKLDYLVGVATEESRRREGHFRDVFVKMLHDEEAAGKPITYLVPVNPAVYAPMGFTFIGNVASYELTEEAKQTLTRTVCLRIRRRTAGGLLSIWNSGWAHGMRCIRAGMRRM
ncbi:MAG: GNAT family N-acetyltransferase [Clostridium fessum]